MYTYSVDQENVLRIFKDGVEISSYGPWLDSARAEAWAQKRIEYMENNPGWSDEDSE